MMTVSIMQSFVMLSVSYAQYHIQALYAEWHYAECHYAESRGAMTNDLPKYHLQV